MDAWVLLGMVLACVALGGVLFAFLAWEFSLLERMVVMVLSWLPFGLATLAMALWVR